MELLGEIRTELLNSSKSLLHTGYYLSNTGHLDAEWECKDLYELSWKFAPGHTQKENSETHWAYDLKWDHITLLC